MPWYSRKRMRLAHDYATAGAYFITICAFGREPLFADGRFRQAVEGRWADLPNHHRDVRLDAFVVMPNHVHGIVWIGQHGETFTALSSVVRSFKAAVTRELRGVTGVKDVWQRGYHDRVVRSQQALDHIRRYIVANPTRWHEDPYNDAQTGASGGEALFWSELKALERM